MSFYVYLWKFLCEATALYGHILIYRIVRHSHLNCLLLIIHIQELPEVVSNLLLEVEDKNTLLMQYDGERQQLQTQIHNQVCMYV